MSDIPRWAIERATEAVRTERGSLPNITAFARYIAAHEEAPVDPLREALQDIFDNWANEKREYKWVDYMVIQLRKRGIELRQSNEQ